MPSKQNHRGQHPKDRTLFGPANWKILSKATHDLSWLISHSYSEKAALKLVGDRYKLKKRQRMSILRLSCSDEQKNYRNKTQISLTSFKHSELHIDGFNLIISVEAALSGGIIFKARDGCWRDIASVHANYNKVAETEKALNIIGTTLDELHINSITWYLDKPVSNSVKLKTKIEAIAKANNWDWKVLLENNPDNKLINCGQVVATSDNNILNQVQKWVNLVEFIIEKKIPEAVLLKLDFYD